MSNEKTVIIKLDTPESLTLVERYEHLVRLEKQFKVEKEAILEELSEMTNGYNAFIHDRKFTLVERKGSISYAGIVRERLPGLDLEPYRGNPTQYWKLS